MRTSALLLGLAALGGALAGLVVEPLPPASTQDALDVRLVDAFPGLTFERPVFAVQPPDGTPRMFVVEQGGRVWSVDHPAPAPPAVAGKRLFLDLRGAVSRIGNEEGLLGLAFHPEYATNRRFFVHYSARYTQAADRRNVLSEMQTDAADPERADPATERTLLTVADPYENHNGGWIGFAPDRTLFVALGDGGSGGDPGNVAQNLGSLLGKILRIDVDPAAGTYGTPPDNPFVARGGARPEIYAYGLRNPWRCSFDRANGRLWTGDVGQDVWEEVDLVASGGNYGWRLREGAHDYRTGATPVDAPIDPVTEYSHAEGRSITGGYVYRGAGIPGLAGAYVFADFVSGRIWTLADPYGAATRALLVDTDEQIASFAEDRAGELYVLSFAGGRVLALRDGSPPPPMDTLPAALSELDLFADLRTLRPAAGARRYRVNTPLWSDGASKSRFLLAPRGASLTWRDADAFTVPDGTFAVKTFARAGHRLETRVIRRRGDAFDAATYRWRDDLSEADRVDERTTATTAGGAWTFPSPDDCRTCHTTAAGFLLGVNARQLDAPTHARWRRSGFLTDAPPSKAFARNAPLTARAPVETRARSYLDANCAFCHRPDDPTNASIDLRATTALEIAGMFDAVPNHGDLGIADARIVAPGDPARSTLTARMRTTGDGRMPQLATSVPHRAAITLLERWIRGMDR